MHIHNHTTARRRVLLVAGVALVGNVLLAACGAGRPGEAGPATVASSGTTVPGTAPAGGDPPDAQPELSDEA
jgi:hypothetical protein